MEESRDTKIRFMPKRYRPQLAGLLSASAEPDSGNGPASAATTIELSLRRATDNFEIRDLNIGEVKPSRYQFRESISESEVEELASSIRSQGVIQPIIVRPLAAPEGLYRFELIAGERRLLASKAAGRNLVPAIIRQIGDREALEVGIIENAQRKDLNPIEEAHSYQRLIDEFDATQAEIAQGVGKSRVAITNAVRLLKLEPEVLELLRSGTLTAGHGRALLGLNSPERQLALARKAERLNLSVRELEELIQSRVSREKTKERAGDNAAENVDLKRAEARLKNLLEIDQVQLRADAQGRKRVTITFDTEASWRRFCSRLRD